MKLIPNWKRAHRFISVQLMALVAGIQGIWPQIPADLKSALPAGVVYWVSIALLIAAVAARLIDQGGITAPEEPKQ